ncbi:MAG: hypothetical protein ACLFO1_06415 [Spirochaetaceae bacterium]
MKKVFVIVLVLIAVAAMEGFGQLSSTRAAGMANASTAVFDHVDVLRTNPAGMAFLGRGHGFIGADGRASYDGTTVQGFDAAARIEFVGSGWGFGFDQRIGHLSAGRYLATTELRSGFAFNLGPIGVGANIRPAVEWENDYGETPHSLIENGTFPDMLSSLQDGTPVPRLRAGVGGMLKFEKLTAGLVVRNFLAIVGPRGDDGPGFFDTADAGVAYRLINLQEDEITVMRLLLSGDARNVGSREFRSYHLGAEADLNLVVLGLTASAGYTMSAAVSDRPNLISLGVGADLLFVTVNAALVVPQYAIAQSNFGEAGLYSLSTAISW